MPLVTRNSENARVWVGTSAPSNPSNGDLFSNTSDDTLTVYDGSTFQTIGATSFSAASTVSYSETIGDYSQPSAGAVASSDAGTQTVYNQTTSDSNFNLGADALNGGSRYGLEVNTSFSGLGKKIKKCRFKVNKVGSPTGSCYARVYNSAGTQVATSAAHDVSTITASPSDELLDLTLTTTHTLTADDRIVLEYSGGDASNYIGVFAKNTTAPTNTTHIKWNGSTWDDPNSAWTPTHVWDFDPTADADVVRDDDTGTVWTSESEANPNIYVDCGGSNTNIVGCAIYLDSATTETEIKIRVDTDTTFTDANNVRTITVSNLTAGAWNYIRFNLNNGRYLQIYGSSGSSLVLSIAEIKYLTKTDSEILQDLGILEISSSDTSIGLDGV